LQVGQAGVTNDGVKNILTAILTAFTLQLTVQVRFTNDGSTSCFIKELVVTR